MRTARAQFGGWRGALAGLCAAAALASAPSARAQIIDKDPPPAVQGLDLIPKLGQPIPLQLEFTDSAGKKVPLSSYFNQGGKPVVLALVYYNCPLMCPLVLQRIQDRLNAVKYQVGEDFNVVVVSFDPLNTTQMASEAKATYVGGYEKDRKLAERGWTFHTSDAGSARLLADAVGFPYRFIPETGQYAHTAVLTVLTPDGHVSGYIDGMGQDSGELRMALLQASEGKIARGIGDFFLHRCYRYNPLTGAYALQAMVVMKIAGLLTVMSVTTLIVGLRAWERARRRKIESILNAAGPVARPAPPASAGLMMGRTA